MKAVWPRLMANVVYYPVGKTTLLAVFNLGALLIVITVIQIVLGLLLTATYSGGGHSSEGNHSFESINSVLCIDLELGLLMRIMHSGIVTVMFAMIYGHIIKYWIYNAIQSNNTTMSLRNNVNAGRNLSLYLIGLVIYFLSVFIAFFGYILVNGSMSLWGSVIILGL